MIVLSKFYRESKTKIQEKVVDNESHSSQATCKKFVRELELDGSFINQTLY